MKGMRINLDASDLIAIDTSEVVSLEERRKLNIGNGCR